MFQANVACVKKFDKKCFKHDWLINSISKKKYSNLITVLLPSSDISSNPAPPYRALHNEMKINFKVYPLINKIGR